MAPDPDDDAPRRLRRAEAVLARRLDSLAVVVEDLHDAHNIDAVVRTSEALGIQRVYRIESDPGEVVHPKVTQGAHRWLTLTRYHDPEACLAQVRADGYQVWAADVAPGARPLQQMELPDKLAVCVGSELEGLTPALREAADARFYLPMVGFTGSLNVSVTAAIVLWELTRRLRERLGAAGDLSEEHKAALRDDWYRRLARTRAQQVSFPAFVDDPPEPLFDDEPPPERRSLEASRGKA